MNTPSDSPSPVSAIETLVKAIKRARLEVIGMYNRQMLGESPVMQIGYAARTSDDSDMIVLDALRGAEDFLQQLLTLERSRQQEGVGQVKKLTKKAERLLSNITPGDWYAHHGKLRDAFPTIIHAVCVEDMEVVKWGGFDGVDYPKSQVRANVDFIAVAPRLVRELLASLTLAQKLETPSAAEDVLTRLRKALEAIAREECTDPENCIDQTGAMAGWRCPRCQVAALLPPVTEG